MPIVIAPARKLVARVERCWSKQQRIEIRIEFSTRRIDNAHVDIVHSGAHLEFILLEIGGENHIDRIDIVVVCSIGTTVAPTDKLVALAWIGRNGNGTQIGIAFVARCRRNGYAAHAVVVRGNLHFEVGWAKVGDECGIWQRAHSVTARIVGAILHTVLVHPILKFVAFRFRFRLDTYSQTVWVRTRSWRYLAECGIVHTCIHEIILLCKYGFERSSILDIVFVWVFVAKTIPIRILPLYKPITEHRNSRQCRCRLIVVTQVAWRYIAHAVVVARSLHAEFVFLEYGFDNGRAFHRVLVSLSFSGIVIPLLKYPAMLGSNRNGRCRTIFVVALACKTFGSRRVVCCNGNVVSLLAKIGGQCSSIERHLVGKRGNSTSHHCACCVAPFRYFVTSTWHYRKRYGRFVVFHAVASNAVGVGHRYRAKTAIGHSRHVVLLRLEVGVEGGVCTQIFDGVVDVINCNRRLVAPAVELVAFVWRGLHKKYSVVGIRLRRRRYCAIASRSSDYAARNRRKNGLECGVAYAIDDEGLFGSRTNLRTVLVLPAQQLVARRWRGDDGYRRIELVFVAALNRCAAHVVVVLRHIDIDGNRLELDSNNGVARHIESEVVFYLAGTIAPFFHLIATRRYGCEFGAFAVSASRLIGRN